MSITSLNDVLEKPFKTYTKEEQQEIVNNGRFTNLNNLCQNDKGKYRMFAVNWYQKVKWLTGNTVNRKLYCWSCVLFPTGFSKIWNSTGFDDLKNLSQSIKKHEDTKEHTYSTVKLKLLLKEKRTHNRYQEEYENIVEVKRNREYLERLIDVASALAHYDIPFRREIDDGFYKYLIGVFKKYDHIVRTQIEESSPFKGLTKTIQIDLVQSIADTVRQRIISEVAAAKFFALQVDEVNCSRVSRQVAVSVRFIEEARPVERLIGLYDVGYNGKADELVTILEKELEKFNPIEKMVAQSFDGGVVKSTEVYDLQQSLKRLQGSQNKCQFIHSYAHEFSNILAQSLRSLQECKLFFALTAQFSTFFQNPALKEVSQNFSVCCENTMFQSIDNLKKNYVNIVLILEYVNTAEEFENAPEIIGLAANLMNHLKSYKFMIFVTIFHNIFSTVEDVFDNMKKDVWAIDENRREINSLTSKLKQMKTSMVFSSLLDEVPVAAGGGQNIVLSNMMDLYIQIIDHIIFETEGRFLDMEFAEFCSLLSLRSIPKTAATRKTPDNSHLICIRETYPGSFDVVKLKTELDLLYSDPAIVGIGEADIRGAGDMLKFIYDNDINECVPMLYRLLELMVTIPSLAEPLEGQGCVFNRIRDYCRVERNEEPRSALALLTIEKDLFYEMKKNSQWYSQVIDYFSTLPSTSSIELIYKSNIAPENRKTEMIAEPELAIKAEPDIF
ncbi:hypothetical protein JTB14_028379 [Gonioctena quinquepunctata]|nr:hypothetical protein JTB14_028379 [Gonioctena quinquepunctata]